MASTFLPVILARTRTRSPYCVFQTGKPYPTTYSHPTKILYLSASPRCHSCKVKLRAFLRFQSSTIMQKVAPTSYLGGACFNLACGQTFDVAEQRLILESAGYQSADMVVERGQYAVRGALVDIFPMGSDLPVRIDLLDDEIDTLRTFDPETQRTVEQIKALNLLPAKEFPFDDAAIARFRDRWHTTFNVDVRRCSVYQDVSSYIAPNGVEYYLPLFFEKLDSLFDYLPQDAIFVLEAGAMAAADTYLTEVEETLRVTAL